MLRLEFEQTLAANEQSGPINREMRNLISSLQNHVSQLKGENQRIKKKIKEQNIELTRLKTIIEENGLRVTTGGLLLPDPKVENAPTSSSSSSLSGVGGDYPNRTQPNEQLLMKPASGSSMDHLMSDSSNDGTLVINTDTHGDESRKEIKVGVV